MSFSYSELQKLRIAKKNIDGGYEKEGLHLNNIISLFLYFSIYAFVGWVMETVYASITAKRFINRGFLSGLFCPIYGFGALLIIIAASWVKEVFSNGIVAIAMGLILSIFSVTVLEYITGYILEKVFKCKWWDYSKDFGNIKGYICVKNSLMWGALAFVLIAVVHPFFEGLVMAVPETPRNFIALLLFIYLLGDTIKSIIDTLGLRKVIINFANFSEEMYKAKIIQYKRFFHAFPGLLILNAEIINRDVRSILNEGLDKIKQEIKTRM